MLYSRRDFGKIALATSAVSKLMAAARPDSRIGGVQIGCISYSWRSMPGANNDANKVLEYCLASGISAIELMDGPAEAYAGAPNAGRGGGMGGPGGRRGAPTPEQLAARQQAAEELKKWRLSQSMSKYKELRKMLNDAGVTVYAHKQTPTMNMSDDEWDYFFQMGAALGADHLTIEMPEDEAFLRKLGDWALKHRMMIGYHAHTQATPTLWDGALGLSKGNGINFDIGHYVAGTGESPMPIIEKHYARITSLHLKDRKKQGAPGGDNLPWGQGDTPIREALQAMRKNKWNFPASIELEYRVPEGSDAVKEVVKCLDYCRAALA